MLLIRGNSIGAHLVVGVFMNHIKVSRKDVIKLSIYFMLKRNVILFFTSLIKDESSRPKYKQLLEHTFVVRSKADPMDVAEFVSGILDKMANNGRVMYTYDSYNC